MRRLLPLVTLLILPLAATAQDPKSLAITAEDTARAKKLAVQLDADDREEREKASEELAKMGRRALPVLKATLTGTKSFEVRRRVGELLPAARVADLAAGGVVFLADTDDKFDHRFEVWDFVREVAGDNTGSRKLMRLILADESNRGVFRAALGDAPDPLLVFCERWMALRDEVYANGKQRPVPDPLMPLAPVAGLLLAEAMRPGEHAKMYHCRAFPIQHAFAPPAVVKAVAGEGEYGAALRKILLKWVDSRDNAEGIKHIGGVEKLFQLGPEYPLRMWERVLQLPECDERSASSAMSNITVRSSDPKWIPLFSRYLDDKRVVIPQIGPLPERQLREVALLGLVALTKQKPADYGIRQIQKDDRKSLDINFYGVVGDKTATADEKRAAGRKKWDEWAKENVKPEPKK